ncbi:MAG TPA: alginate lyase family protein [Rhizomicrobium sp.]|jgi:hypothetical protein
MNLRWYLRRLAAMGPREIATRVADRAQEHDWRQRYFETGKAPFTLCAKRKFVSGLSRARDGEAPEHARERLLRVAEKLLDGKYPTFAIQRTDVTSDVDWFLDPKTGARAPTDDFTFDIGFVGGAPAFDTKYIWELSRHHQTTLLAMAYWLTGEERYARAAAAQIQSWIGANPFLAGIHWASGIELGLRLIAFAWTRRLLADWPEVSTHFEDNEDFARAVVLHQWWLANRRSRGSSANNHLIYEMAGLYVSASCMSWHARAAHFRDHAAAILECEFPRQIFGEGYARELASDYNGFVLEALLVCLIEGVLSGHPIGAGALDCARRMFAWLAKNSDCRGDPARQGDSDEASGLLLDAPDYDRWHDLAYVGETWFGSTPREASSLRGWLLAPLAQNESPHTPNVSSPRKRGPSSPIFPGMAAEEVPNDSGLVVLRARRGTHEEIWCAFDAGPLGYLSLAAHGHADALAIELRYGGLPVLVDPGTYAYAGPWREYFRSTAAHNTIELDGRSQSESGGPFLWTRHARTRLLAVDGLAEDSPIARAAGEHEGYARTRFRGRHRRDVELDRRAGTLRIADTVSAARAVRLRMFYHLHLDIGCALYGHTAELARGGATIRLALPEALAWRAVRGSDRPGPGWYSPAFDVKVPATVLIGETTLEGALVLETLVRWSP